MHYTIVFNPGTLLHCDSSANAEIILEYLKTQLHFRLMNKLMVDADPSMCADGLPDYLTLLRWVADTVGFATESGYVRYDFVEHMVDSLILMGAEVHSRHWYEAFQQGVIRSRQVRDLSEISERMREEFYSECEFL
jgi:hypothetical protein